MLLALFYRGQISLVVQGGWTLKWLEILEDHSWYEMETPSFLC